MASLSVRKIRQKLNIADENIPDMFTFEAWRGSAIVFQVGVFNGDDVIDLDTVTSINMRVKDSQTGTSTLMDKTVAAVDLDLTLTAEDWLAGTDEHCSFEYSNAEANLTMTTPKMQLWVVFTALLTSGSSVTLGGGTFFLHEDNNAAADPPEENLGTAITIEEADARYATLAQGTDERVPTAAGLISKFSTNKATIIDADKVAIFDSAATDTPKHSLFSLIKSTLKTYFDGFYVALTGNQTVAGVKTFSDNISASNLSGTNTGDLVNFIRGSDYGIISGDSLDATAEANATALQTAITASATLQKILLLSGDVYVKGQVLITGVGIRICGPARIIQKDIAHNGLTINPTPLAAFNILIEGINIVGQGAATHNAAGFFGQAAALIYLTSDVKLVDCRIDDFRTGLNLAGIAKFRTENLSIYGCRVCEELNHIQSSLQTNARMVQGDNDAASCCFKLTGGNWFADEIIGGEFGGSGIQKFADVTSGRLHVSGVNLEAFGSQALIDRPGVGDFEVKLVNSRIAINFSDATRSIISCEVNGNSGRPVVEFHSCHGWSGSPRFLEIYGSDTTGGASSIIGHSIETSYAATKGGAETRRVIINPSRINYTSSASFPVSTALPGRSIALATSGQLTDDWAQPNKLERYNNNNTSTRAWSSTLNDVLIRVLYVNGRVASGNNVETDIHNYTLPIGVLRNSGESVDISLFGSCAANANNKHFRFYFGGSLYLDFGLLPINGNGWTLDITIQRGSFAGGTGYMKLMGRLVYGSACMVKVAETPSATIDSSATIATRVTILTPTAASDAVSLAAKTIWKRAVTAI